LPLAESEEVVSLRKACREFIDEAQPLQNQLLERQAEMKNSSWLQSWWNTLGYLQVRDPVVLFVSYFFQLPDNSTAATGIQRGAAVLRASVVVCQRVSTGTLPQEVMNDTPLCSAAYKYMFHACRIPKPHQDTYQIYKPKSHAIVTCRNQVFSMPVLNDNGGILPLSTIENSLQECDERAKQTPNQLELGWLTTSNRNDWAHAHKELLRIGGQEMERALNDLESGMLLLCLDDNEPVSYRQRALEYWHGGMQLGGNRWFDKSIQLVVSRNGKLGYIGEHSMMDGMPAVGLCQHLKTESYAKQKASQKNTLSDKRIRNVKIACTKTHEREKSKRVLKRKRLRRVL
jgi:carnitine O-acetyltransferase